MRIVIRLLVVAGLAIDVYVHVHLAKDFSYNNNGLVTGQQLFWLEAIAAAAAGLQVLFWPNRVSYFVAFVVAAAGVAAVVFYRYVDPGPILGVIPGMYEPIWTTEKVVSLVGEAVAAVAALVGFLMAPKRVRESANR
ncbi:MAG: hypothetical protein JWN52_5871 [Actinomycetia bacterium]|jgi:hypothetical protein|nr:hypothetical protein [Actinomycetes bacterium]